MLKQLGLPLLALSLMICSITSIAQDTTKWNTINYPVDFEDESIEDLTFLDSDIQNYNFICTSEFHRSELAIVQYKKFIKYLIEKRGLDKLVMERPYAYGYLITNYINTGDTTFLRAATDKFWSFDKFSIDSGISHDSYSLFEWLYNYLKKKGKSIEVVGIDLNQSLHGTLELYTLKFLLEKNKLGEKFPNSYSELLLLAKEEKPSLGKLKKWLAGFKEELVRNGDVKELMQGDYKVLEQIALAIDDLIIYGNGSNKGKSHREQTMLRNFKNQVSPDDIIYAQFGAGHIAIGELPRFTGFMYLLQDTREYANRTLSISLHCLRCRLGKSTSAYKPYGLKEDGSGYWWNDGAYILNEAGEEKDHLISELENRSTAIDFRGALPPFDFVKNQFQYLIILF